MIKIRWSSSEDSSMGGWRGDMAKRQRKKSTWWIVPGNAEISRRESQEWDGALTAKPLHLANAQDDLEQTNV
ncbi:hypothetical protein N7488_002491 [Penicillium malachiteum]|nr:hypothetical protein N7488_002491 [Penicillium malachiteum]